MVKNYNVELDVITPVIINNGETYDFWEYIPLPEKAGIKNEERIDLPLIRKVLFPSIETFLKKLTPSEMNMFIKSASDAVCSNNNSVLLNRREEILNKIDKDTTFKGRFLPDAFKDLYYKPNSKVDKICTLPLSGATYIPGSSIKGSIRTAFLEALREEKGLDHWRNVNNYNSPRQDIKGARNFEMEVINGSDKFKIDDDPFKYLKVSDFNFEKVDKVTYIGKIMPDESYSAMTNSYIYGGKRVTAKGTISLDDKIFKKQGRMVDGFESILKNVDSFYWNNYEYKSKTANNNVNLTRIKGNRSIDNVLADDNNSQKQCLMDQVHDKIIREHKNGFFIRLGHYIGIQNYTFNVNQLNPPQKAKAKEKINIKGGKTKTIEGGVIPGICLMKIMGEDNE